MKSALFVLLLIGFASAARSQIAANTRFPFSTRNQVPGGYYGSGYGARGAEYVQVQLAPVGQGVFGSAYGQNFQGRFGQGGAQYVGVSLAPRRNQPVGPGFRRGRRYP